MHLLDTNTVAHIVDGRSLAARAAMIATAKQAVVAISAITEGELMYGLARKPEAVRFGAGIEVLLASVRILPWDSAAARAYGTLRARMASSGKSLSNMHMLIAAQAIASDAILVTRDGAFAHAEGLRPVANWAADI
jgi:tRNA(fMet)-specific endonuclease VapC